ncbi:porin family protein [Edaphobacter aggregans]|uniref:porin family protein n=1 Tax=Edaphobacter aggregans TaxID=570835 RepID=UPI001639995F|nr:porin family protein [Edaphobacter aggregans]
MFKRILVFIVLLGGTSMLHAQASPTASRRGDLQIGVGYTNANTDYVPNRVNGGTAYFTYDFKPHFGIEGDFRFIKDSPTNYYEKSYEIGGRYYRTYKEKWVPYGRVMYGRGVFNFTSQGVTTANLAYNLAAVGAGLDYKVLPYLNVRGDFHYQRWFGFPQNGLTPSMFTIGVAYHFR